MIRKIVEDITPVNHRKIGFIQGVAYAASMMIQHNFDAYDLILQSGLPVSEIRKYTDETDLKHLDEVLKSIEK